MTNLNPTLGPWTYEYSPYTAQDGHEIPAYEIHGKEKVCDTNENRPEAEQRANAHLIAAAPELLAALRMALQALNTAPRFKVPHLETDSYRIASVCDAALAKAKGGAA